MLGGNKHGRTAGIIPCAISWLFNLLHSRKEAHGTRFSVRISAVEISGPDEQFRDLLADTGMNDRKLFCISRKAIRYTLFLI